MEGEEQIRLLKKQVDENAAKIIEAEAKQKSAKDLFEGDSRCGSVMGDSSILECEK